MMKFKALLVFLCFTTLFFGQHKLGKVTVEELKESVHPIDSSANAAILFKIGKTNFEGSTEGKWVIVTEINYKIKIYNKEGLDNATQIFSYYVGGETKEEVFIKNAVTYNLVNGKIEKTKLKREGEFEEKVNEDWEQKKITMPSVKEGSIIEFTYTLTSPYLWNLNDFYLQSSIPINYVDYTLNIPEKFNYRTTITGYEDVKTERILKYIDDLPEYKNYYLAENVPGIRVEDHVHNVKNYMSAVKSELVSAELNNGFSENYSTSWEDVVKTIYESKSFGRELGYSSSYFEDDLNQIIASVSSTDEKILKILNFVQNRMSWNGNNGYYCELGVKKAYAEQLGNVADINLMLVAMLRYAGIVANPILLSTRNNGVVLYPDRSAFNYVIAGVEVENNVVLLDATSKISAPNIIPLNAINWNGRVVREYGSSAEINLFNIAPSLESNTILAELNENGTIKGKIRRQYYDYNAFVYKDYFLKLSEEDKIQKIEKSYNGILINNLKYKVEDKIVTEEYDFEHNNIAEKIKDKIYLSPALFFTLSENPFKAIQRKFPIDFEFPYKDLYKFSIKIPKGYMVEQLTAEKRIGLDKGYANYSLSAVSRGDVLQVVISFEINNIIIPATEYGALQFFYSEIVKNQGDKIVLKKIE